MNQVTLQDFQQEYHEEGYMFFFGLLFFVSFVFAMYFYVLPTVQSLLNPSDPLTIHSVK